MATNDFFGYNNRTTHGPGHVLASSMCAISIGGGGVIGLAQGVNLTYGRENKYIMEIGSSDMWIAAGPPKGSLEISRTVGTSSLGGSSPLLQPFKPASCSDAVSILIQDSKGSACGSGLSPGTVECTGCMLTQVGISMAAEQVIVQDKAAYSVGNVNVN